MKKIKIRHKNKMTKCILNLTGKTETTLTLDLPQEWFESDDCSSLLYNCVCANFPNNNWDDLVCENITYSDNFIEIEIATY